jgi:hypothetical protein
MIACPCCGSVDVDMELRRCNSCETYLPTGSFDKRPRYRQGRAGMRANEIQRRAVHSDKKTESITGGAQ